MLRKLYANVYFRVPFKFFIALGTTKITYDFFSFFMQGNKLGLARFVHLN